MLWHGIDLLSVPPPLLVIRQRFAAKMNYKIRCVAMIRVRKPTVGRKVNTCHATRGFLAAVGPYPRPDCGEAQIPGGWAVQQDKSKVKVIQS